MRISEKKFTVLGLDPSTKFGVALVSATNGEIKFTYATTINYKEAAGLDRAIRISNSVLEIANQFQPNLVVIEGYAFGNAFSLATLVEIGTLVRSGIVSAGYPLGTMAPNALKKWLTGKGTAKKEMMLLELYKRFDIEADDDNQADAFGLATAGLAYLGAIKCNNANELETVSTISKITCQHRVKLL